MGDLEDALAVEQVDDDSWTATADPRYESSNGMLGGWTLAVALLGIPTRGRSLEAIAAEELGGAVAK